MKPCHRFQPAKNWISPVDERCMLDDARNANRLSRSIIEIDERGGGCPRGLKIKEE